MSNFEIVIFADTLDEVKQAIEQELRRRAEALRNAGRNKTDKTHNARAAFELDAEADWLGRTIFRPKSENPFNK